MSAALSLMQTRILRSLSKATDGWLSHDALVQAAYQDQQPPEHARAVIRCQLQRLRKRRRSHKERFVAVPGGYALVREVRADG